MSKKYYSYYINSTSENGIVTQWSECQKKVSGKNAKFKSFPSYDEALNWLKNILSPENSEKKIYSNNNKSKKYYGCYFIKTQTFKIFDNWEECLNSKNSESCRCKSFKTYDEAKSWCENGGIYETKENIKNSLPDGIYFDAGTGRGIGVESKVSFKDGVSILPKFFPEENLNEFGNLFLGMEKTNNFGELKALDMALDIAFKENILKIFGDSSLVINYWSKGFIKSDIDCETISLAKSVTLKRIKFENIGGTIEHISGDFNPADLGFHK